MTDTERAEYERRIEELLDVLEDLANAHCYHTGEGAEIDTVGSSSGADALRSLERSGRFRIVKDDSNGRVRGYWIPAADRKPPPAPARDVAADADAVFGRFVGERYQLPRGSC